jgi:hypothetical protein
MQLNDSRNKNFCFSREMAPIPISMSAKTVLIASLPSFSLLSKWKVEAMPVFSIREVVGKANSNENRKS